MDVIAQLIRGTETVLLVDDENIILEVGKAMLESLGYTILVAPNGKRALQIVSNGKAQVDLVMLDLVMPGMDGQTADVMKKGCKGFIQKPFSIVELSQLVRKVLDS